MIRSSTILGIMRPDALISDKDELETICQLLSLQTAMCARLV